MQAAEESGQFSYIPPAPVDDEDKDKKIPSVSDDAAPTSPSQLPDTEHVNRKMV